VHDKEGCFFTGSEDLNSQCKSLELRVELLPTKELRLSDGCHVLSAKQHGNAILLHTYHLASIGKGLFEVGCLHLDLV
jgi:hypothetical protein